MSKNDKRKVVMFHGIENKELSKLLELIKNNVPDPENYIFASTTPTALGFTVENWLEELAEEQKQMMETIRESVKTKRNNNDLHENK